MIDARLEALRDWLANDDGLDITDIKPASEDASFRRYFRVFTRAKSYIAMDAPPDKEPIHSFIDIALLLSKLGIHAPEIHRYDPELGFILLEDLGAKTYFDVLPKQADSLYDRAIDVLIRLQGANLKTDLNALTADQIPHYSAAKLVQELDLFRRWFVEKHLQTYPYEAAHAAWLLLKQLLTRECLVQPQVLVHRDFHCRNLMVTAVDSPGVIDFQDMVIGPISYDLVSIFKDCYIEWPRAQQLDWLTTYRTRLEHQWSSLPFDLDELIRWFDLTGLQRHLKVLGIFCRLHYRDGKGSYLDNLPLVAKYVLEVLQRYPELGEFERHYTHLIEQAL